LAKRFVKPRNRVEIHQIASKDIVRLKGELMGIIMEE